MPVPAHTRAALRGLPEQAVQSLCAAFSDEVAERLPGLLRFARQCDSDDPTLLSDALRDAHTLGSSAFVVGEHEAGRLARRAEKLLLAGGDLTPLPGVVDELHEALREWQR